MGCIRVGSPSVVLLIYQSSLVNYRLAIYINHPVFLVFFCVFYVFFSGFCPLVSYNLFMGTWPDASGDPIQKCGRRLPCGPLCCDENPFILGDLHLSLARRVRGSNPKMRPKAALRPTLLPWESIYFR